ncbi:MAG: peptidoglycan-binding domain-containing protein [Terriglobia bacterium]
MQPLRFLSALVLFVVFSAASGMTQSQHKNSHPAPTVRASSQKVRFQKKPTSTPNGPKNKASASKRKTSKKKHPARPRGQLRPDAERTREIQEKLVDSGAMAGTPNGVWDPKPMEEAIRKFQQTHGLNATGKLDVKTLKAMGLKS